MEGNQAMQLLSGIKSTRCLKLSAGVARILSCAFDGNMPIFPNLTNLELAIEPQFGWKMLPHFLMNAPNLQDLTLNLYRSEFLAKEKDRFEWFNLENVPSRLLFHVKRIRFQKIAGKFTELKVIRYLLKHSNVLENFSVHTDIRDSEKAKEFREIVLESPICSPLCEINFFFRSYLVLLGPPLMMQQYSVNVCSMWPFVISK